MILSIPDQFAKAISVAAAAGTAVIGDVVDLMPDGETYRDIGDGESIYLVIGVDTSIVAAGAGTIKFQLASDSVSTLDSSPTVHFDTGTIVTGTSAAGKCVAGQYIAIIKLPSGNYERYLGILCIIASQTVSAGKINAFLTRNVANWHAYDDNVN